MSGNGDQLIIVLDRIANALEVLAVEARVRMAAAAEQARIEHVERLDEYRRLVNYWRRKRAEAEGAEANAELAEKIEFSNLDHLRRRATALRREAEAALARVQLMNAQYPDVVQAWAEEQDRERAAAAAEGEGDDVG